MKAIFKGYEGEVVSINGVELFYTLDPTAKVLWKNYDIGLLRKGVPADAYCWWLCYEDNAAVTFYDGRRRMI